MTGADTVVLPEVSRARAVSVCAPLGTPRVSQGSRRARPCPPAPADVPSTKNCTPATPTLSAALAVMVTMSLTWALFAGEMMDTDGAPGPAG